MLVQTVVQELLLAAIAFDGRPAIVRVSGCTIAVAQRITYRSGAESGCFMWTAFSACWSFLKCLLDCVRSEGERKWPGHDTARVDQQGPEQRWAGSGIFLRENGRRPLIKM